MKERREIVELRKRDNEDGSMSIEGYAVVFNSPATYDGETEIYLESTDEWWESLSPEQKQAVYEEFFNENN